MSADRRDGGARRSIIALLAVLSPSTAPAQAQVSPTVVDLEARVEALEAEYAARQAELQRATEARLAALRAEIAALKAKKGVSGATASRGPGLPAASRPDPSLDTTGDFRLRYEHTSAHAGFPSRDRGVLRGRIGATYTLNDRFTLGGRLVTGDPDDPNSADVTMGEFVDDLTVSLDQAYARYRFGNFDVVVGKFANPFGRTELVWDGDVGPYGLASQYALYDGSASTVRVAAVYSAIDEQIVARGSDMVGAQLSLDFKPAADWRLGFDAAYYDYEIGSLLAADSGDIRGNNLTPDRSDYLSDFDLLDFIVRLDYIGLDRPISIVGDYVRNIDAAVPEDSGWSLHFALGEHSEAGNWRIEYGFVVAETDAVLAAFSHDNTTYATNYREHTISIDYRVLANTLLNLTGYLYRRDDLALVSQSGYNDWVARIRLNLQLSFQ